MRLLYLTNKPLFPTVDGGCRAMAQMLYCLIELGIEIDHVCLSTHKHPYENAAYPEQVRNRISIDSVNIDTRIKPLKALASLCLGKSYNIHRFDSFEVRHLLRRMLQKKNYDIVFLESLYTTTYIDTVRKFSKSKIILRSHNIEFKLWEQLTQKCPSGWRKLYLHKLTRDLRNYEIKTLELVDSIFSITQNDLQTIQAEGIKRRNVHIPVALNQTERKVDDDTSSLFFIGSMNWEPNFEAVNHLVTKIYPEVRKIIPSAELHIAGSYMNGHFTSDPSQGITNHGFAEDLQGFMQKHGVLVLPIKSGSGVRIKLLEAMSLGVPIVSSPVGALGFSEENGLRIANDDETMIEQVVQLLQKPSLRKELGDSAWNHVNSHLSIQKVSQMIADEFKS